MSDVSPVFWILAVIIFVSSVLVVTLKNVFHSALFLILTLFSVAGIFVLLHAEFLAAAQVLIYVGAVAILMIFAIMLTRDIASDSVRQVNKHALTGFFVCVVFAIGVFWIIRTHDVWTRAKEALPADNILTIGKLLMTHYMLPFEIISVLLLAAMIGAIALARGDRA